MCTPQHGGKLPSDTDQAEFRALYVITPSVLVPCPRCLTAASLTQRSIKSKARLGWTEEENLLEAHEFAYFVTIPMPVLPFVRVNQNTTPSLTDCDHAPPLQIVYTTREVYDDAKVWVANSHHTRVIFQHFR